MIDIDKHDPVRCNPYHHCWVHCGECGEDWPCTAWTDWIVSRGHSDSFGNPCTCNGDVVHG